MGQEKSQTKNRMKKTRKKKIDNHIHIVYLHVFTLLFK